MVVFDQLNRKIELISANPQRIVSLVPSQTELLSDLKLDDQVIGITSYCVHPKDWRRKKVIVGGTKNFNLSKIKSLNPDLIIANKEENQKEKLELLMKDFPVWISDVRNLDSAIEMINSIGLITSSESISKGIVNDIQSSLLDLKTPKKNRKKVAYLIWDNPIMSVNSDTFIDNMLSINGWDNCFANYSKRYPEISMEEINIVNPDYVFLSSEPFPFSDKHIEKFSSAINKSKVILVNGEYFSWYGSRLKYAMSYFKELKKSIV